MKGTNFNKKWRKKLTKFEVKSFDVISRKNLIENSYSLSLYKVSIIDYLKIFLKLLFGVPFRVLEVTIIKFLHIYALKRGSAVAGLNVGKPALSNKKDPDE